MTFAVVPVKLLESETHRDSLYERTVDGAIRIRRGIYTNRAQNLVSALPPCIVLLPSLRDVGKKTRYSAVPGR